MAPYEIRNLDELLTEVLEGAKLLSASLSNLTSAGENYGSAIFSLEITAKRDGGTEKKIRAVAKMLPQNEFIQKLFNSQKTFRNEVGFYEQILPCLRRFQEERGLTEVLSSSPDFYAARYSLEPVTNQVDTDAVLLIKNIKDEGFTLLDRKVGFDLQQSELILEKMAEFHATVIGLRSVKPEVFQSELGRFFHEFGMFEDDGVENTDGALKLTNSLIELLKDDEFCRKNVTRIRETLASNTVNSQRKNNKAFQKSVFASIVHGDMWTNNIMIKIVDNKPVDVKFVDYQIYEFSSLTRDVVFFLFSSVQLPIIQKYLDHLLLHYFNSFVSNLKKLKCDPSIYKFDEFLTELGSIVKRVEFFHIMLMLRPIFALEKDAKEVDDLKRGDMVDNKMELAEGCKPKAYFIVRELIKRNWI